MFFFAHTGITLGIAEMARVASAWSSRRAGRQVIPTGSLDSAGAAPESSNSVVTKPRPSRVAWGDPPAPLAAYLVLFLGSLLPDIIDKPLGVVFLGSFFSSGRTLGHTLVFVALLAGFGALLFLRRGKAWGLVLAGAVAVHLILDEMWTEPRVILWPLYGWTFSSGHGHGNNWIQGWIEDLLEPHYYVPEMVGFLVLAWFVWHAARIHGKRLRAENADKVSPL
jgi:inner membrane protein